MDENNAKSFNDTPLLRKVLNEASDCASEFDPSGSYTGQPLDQFEKPVQDADDL